MYIFLNYICLQVNLNRYKQMNRQIDIHRQNMQIKEEGDEKKTTTKILWRNGNGIVLFDCLNLETEDYICKTIWRKGNEMISYTV